MIRFTYDRPRDLSLWDSSTWTRQWRFDIDAWGEFEMVEYRRGLYDYDTDRFRVPAAFVKPSRGSMEWEIIESVGYDVIPKPERLTKDQEQDMIAATTYRGGLAQ